MSCQAKFILFIFHLGGRSRISGFLHGFGLLSCFHFVPKVFILFELLLELLLQNVEETKVALANGRNFVSLNVHWNKYGGPTARGPKNAPRAQNLSVRYGSNAISLCCQDEHVEATSCNWVDHRSYMLHWTNLRKRLQARCKECHTTSQCFR